METLDGTEWDVVISGTGLPQSLLALSLSRSGKRILHLDQNDYYGGDEAAFSLSEAEAWAKRFAAADAGSTFSRASVSRTASQEDVDNPRLAPPRAYSLSLAPQLIYARSALVPAIVSSRIHTQLDFQAVGSWFIVEEEASGSSKITRVPSSREGVFQDKSLDLNARRPLMRFLMFVKDDVDKLETWQDDKDTPFPDFLEQKFRLPPASHGPILALTMSAGIPRSTTTAYALPRIARHLRSIGIFGPGFGAVLPKWGGLAEIAQVACRACAVGGGVYVLKKGVEEVESRPADNSISLQLTGSEKVSTSWLVGGQYDLPPSFLRPKDEARSTAASSRSISIISSPLTSLFPPTSEGGVTPAGAVVVIPSATDEPPVHILVHTSDAGECPMNQCILYASISLSQPQGSDLLDQAIASLLSSVNEEPAPRVLWSMRYQQMRSQAPSGEPWRNDGVIILPSLSQDLVLEDEVLESVKSAWQKITGESEETIMVFEAREGMDDEDQ